MVSVQQDNMLQTQEPIAAMSLLIEFSCSVSSHAG